MGESTPEIKQNKEAHAMPQADIKPSARTLNVLRDPSKLRRTANHLSWNADGTKLAVAYSDMEFANINDKNQVYDSYVWDIDAPNKPSDKLSPHNSPCVTLEYNPKDQHVVLGGCQNGQVCFWDTRKGSRPCDTSPIEKSHRDPAHAAIWMQTKTGNDCLTASSDGQVFWWDIRKGLHECVDSLILDPTKFMVGTEQGTIISCNRKAKTAADKIAALYHTHTGPIFALERNPFASKLFLTAGDWTARIWSEDIKESSIMATKYHDYYLSDAAWSPHRPAVFYSARQDGYLDCWDLLFKQNTPTLSVSVFNEAIQSLRPNHAKPGLLAVGSHAGQTALIQLSDNFCTSDVRVEKAQMQAQFDRETKREKILESRQKEMKLKERERSGRIASAGSGGAASKHSEETAEGDNELSDSKMDWEKGLELQVKGLEEKHAVDLDDLTIEL